MAVQKGSATQDARGNVLYSWSALLNGNQGSPADAQRCAPGYTTVTMQVTGTFGAGGTLHWEGSVDGTNWFSIVGFTAAGLANINNNVPFFRPNITAGDGTTSLNVKLWLPGVQ